MPYMDFAHSTPVIIDVQGKPQMLIATAACFHSDPAAMQSLDPADGKRLWWCWGQGDVLFAGCRAGSSISTAAGGGPGVAVDTSGQGDVTATHTGGRSSQCASSLSAPRSSSAMPLSAKRNGVLKCWNAATGKHVYAERLAGSIQQLGKPHRRSHGNIYFANGRQELVLEAGPEFKVLAVNDLGDNNHASAAVASGKMFLVGEERLLHR